MAAAPDLDQLRACTQDCQACPLGPGRIRFVFGEGSVIQDCIQDLDQRSIVAFLVKEDIEIMEAVRVQ